MTSARSRKWGDGHGVISDRTFPSDQVIRQAFACGSASVLTLLSLMPINRLAEAKGITSQTIRSLAVIWTVAVPFVVRVTMFHVKGASDMMTNGTLPAGAIHLHGQGGGGQNLWAFEDLDRSLTNPFIAAKFRKLFFVAAISDPVDVPGSCGHLGIADIGVLRCSADAHRPTAFKNRREIQVGGTLAVRPMKVCHVNIW